MKKVNNSKIVVVIYRIITILVTVSAILINTIGEGTFRYRAFAYYTLQSNLLVLITTGILLVTAIKELLNKQERNQAKFSTLHFFTSVDIAVTFLVYWLLLAPTMSDTSIILTYHNISVHGLVPLLCIFDYILFTRPVKSAWKRIFLTWFFPLAYVVFALVAGFSGYVFQTAQDGTIIRFPYFFLDYDQVGFLVIVWVAVLLAFFSLIAFLLNLYDSKRINKQKPQES